MVAHLDTTLASLVSRELKALSELMKKKYWEEKEAYWNMLEKKESKNEEEEEDEVEGKQEDSASVTIGSKDEEGEDKDEDESPSKCAEVHEEELGGNKATPAAGTGTEASEINPNASNKSEEKDWQQMLRLVMLLQNEGNFLIKEKHFQEASAKFREAIEYVDFLQNTVSVIDYVMRLCKSMHKSNNVVFIKCKIKPSVMTTIVQMDARIDADHIDGLQSKPFSVMNGLNLPESSLTKRIVACEL